MIIHNARFVTWGNPNEILIDKALLVRHGKIERIEDFKALKQLFPDEELFDVDNQLVMPGNICAHTHYYGAFSRGMAIPGAPPSNFVQILQQLWWKLDKALDADAIKYSVLVCLIDAIKHGTTTLIDHHSSPNAIDGSLDIITEVIEEAGLRGALCYEVTDRDGLVFADAGIQENLRFIKKLKNNKNYHPLIKAHFGLHASMTISDRTLEKCAQACPSEIGYHSHVAEGKADQDNCLKLHHKRVIERFEDFGILKNNSIMAHGIHLEPGEVDILTKRRTWLTHQPRSNMNNAVGVANIEEMLASGMRIGMGNDGFSNAMWEEWKAAYLIHKDHHADPRKMNGSTVMDLAVYNNADLVTELFKGLRIGEIAEGAAADLMFVDYREFTPLSASNLPWHILFGFRDSMVSATMVAGKFLMRDRQLLTLDENEIYFKALESARRVWQRVQD